MQQKKIIKSYEHCNIKFSSFYFLLGMCLFKIIFQLAIKSINFSFFTLSITIGFILMISLIYHFKNLLTCKFFLDNLKKLSLYKILNLPLWFSIYHTPIIVNILSLFLGIIWINWHVYDFNKNNHYAKLIEGKHIIMQATVLNLTYLTKEDHNDVDNTLQIIKDKLPTRIVQLDLLVNKVINNNLINPNVKNIEKYLLNQKIKVTWKTNQVICPNDIWQLSVRLKKPRNFSTLGNLDLERKLFMQKIKLIGMVSNKNIKENKFIDNKQSLYNYSSLLNKIRNKIFDQLFTKMQTLKLKHSGIILGFLLGNKLNITSNEKLIFQATGTSHLLCISGLHLGTIAGFIFIIAKYLWKKLSNRCLLENSLAILAPSILAILFTNFYAILAGLTLPTARALIMLNGYFIGIITRNIITIDLLYFLSILLILIADPFAILSNSFWLSYMAVGILIFTSNVRLEKAIDIKSKKSMIFNNILNLLKNNWIMFIGLLPINILIFNKIYLISYIANLIAIPWFNFLILPWSMLGLLANCCSFNLAKYLFILSDFNLHILLNMLSKLAKFKNASISLGVIDIPIFCISLIGSLLLILPKGLKNIYIAMICFLPVFFKYKVAPKYAGAWISILDVGQGLAVVIKLQQHIILYDTGPNNSVIDNYLSSLNIYNLDQVIISHPDLDHIGGLKKLVNNKYKINNFVSNTNDYKVDHLKSTFCKADIIWELDGVKFQFLSPKPYQLSEYEPKNNNFLDINDKNNLAHYKKSYFNKKNSKNDNSCILQMSSDNYKVLFTGDISSKTEKLLINKYKQNLAADLLIVPHHGSISSSSEEFLKTVNPKYAIISAGYMNKYNHPHPQVLDRYKNANIKILNTIKHGTIDIKLFNQSNKLKNKNTKNNKLIDNFMQYNCHRKDSWNFWNY